MQSYCNMIFTSCATFGKGNSEPDMVRSKAPPQGVPESSRGLLLTGYVHIRIMLSRRDRFCMQDETFNAVYFLSLHPIFTSPLLSHITTVLYLTFTLIQVSSL